MDVKLLDKKRRRKSLIRPLRVTKCCSERPLRADESIVTHRQQCFCLQCSPSRPDPHTGNLAQNNERDVNVLRVPMKGLRTNFRQSLTLSRVASQRDLVDFEAESQAQIYRNRSVETQRRHCHVLRTHNRHPTYNKNFHNPIDEPGAAGS